ncbi:MAG: WD40 repeat-containing protein [Solidesulfovibrio magneticus str. Maddingley MBC34]|uniref:WD40 repeat-containing protein n=1 Tax=Solidesulfovibrio magneticus str. Maddingley MBC34 TaxID=1206767 RepID=K6GQP2_9BACT|nr:MAG: WD40 repeat-containing protein [Solidesulfovibrio magneticus str. Maddingley MBC34]
MRNETSAVSDYKYFAFISYSHRDKKWGDWLHKAIETYKIPKRLQTEEQEGNVLPKRLFPVFRDREELPTSADLGEQITGALRHSRFLIVICSPNAARSIWVNEEIKAFKAMGRENRILSLIVDGEPNASDKPGDEKTECFPEAMRFRVDAEGNLTGERSEPIAADIRPGMDGRQNALLKLVAGLLGVGFDTLRQRENERRVRRLMAAGAVMAVLLLAFAGLAWRAWLSEQQALHEKQRAEKNELQAKSRLSELYSREGSKSRHDVEWANSLLWYSRSLKNNNSYATHFSIVDSLNRIHFETTALRGHTDTVDKVLISTNEKFMASSAHDNELILWDRDNGNPLAALSIDHEGVTDFIFNHNSTLLACLSDKHTVRIWKLDKPQVDSHAIAKITGVSAITFQDSGENLVLNCNDGVQRYWNVFRRKLSKESKTVQTIHKLSPGGSLGAIESKNGVELVDINKNKIQATFNLRHGNWVTSSTFSPDSTSFVIGARYSGLISIFDLSDLDSVNPTELLGHKGEIVDLSFSPDSQMLASASWDNTVRTWTWSGWWGATRAVLRGHEGRVAAVAFAPDGKNLVSGGWDQAVRLWEGDTTRTVKTLSTTGVVLAITFSPDSRFVAAATSDKQVMIWNRSSGEPAGTLTGHTESVKVVAFSPDGRLIASGATDGKLSLWDWTLGTRIAAFQGGGALTAIACSPDGQLLASGESDGSIRLWDVATGQQLHKSLKHQGAIQTLVFSPDGHTLASGAKDKLVYLWDIPTGARRLALKAHVSTVNDITFSNNGIMLATADDMDFEDGLIHLWDFPTGRELKVLHAEGESINSVAFSPSADIIASTGYDESISLWDSQSGRLVDRLVIDDVISKDGHVAFSPDGRALALSGHHALYLWDTGSDDQLADRLAVATSIGISYDLDDNGLPVPKDPVLLAQARLDAAKIGRIWWREDGGKSLVPLYENELAQATKFLQTKTASETNGK